MSVADSINFHDFELVGIFVGMFAVGALLCRI